MRLCQELHFETMKRIKLLTRGEMNERQQSVYDTAVAGPRGRAPAPMLAWMQSPEFADRAQRLGEFVRYETSLPARLSELAILLVARIWTAQYEWFAHKKEALKAGLDTAIIDDIAHRLRPRCAKHDELVVHDFSLSLCTLHSVSDDLYRELVETIGERTSVELVGLLGYYTLIAMTVNTFAIGLPEGVVPELE